MSPPPPAHRSARSPTISAPKRPSPPRCWSAISIMSACWAQALDEVSLTPRARLRCYLEIISGKLEADGFARGCLIGDLSLEASGSSELLRTQLDAIFAEWREPFAAC